MGILLWLLYVFSVIHICLALTIKQYLDGRRPILLISLLILCIGSVGSGAATTVSELLTWRVIQAFGASSGLSVGIGVLADIYKMEERGTASGAFFGVRVLSYLRHRWNLLFF